MMTNTIARQYSGAAAANGCGPTAQVWQVPLPAGRIIAVFDSHTQAANVAETMPNQVSIMQGIGAANAIDQARHASTLVSRLVSHLNGEDELATRIQHEATTGSTILVVDSAEDATGRVFNALKDAGAREMYAVGRWTRESIIR